MDFYFDENLPKTIAIALDTIEQHRGNNKVFSTEIVWGKEVKDIPLFHELKKVNGILVTTDAKMKTRSSEFQAIKDLKIGVIMLSLPSACNYEIIYRRIFDLWEDIKKETRKETPPYILRITMRGKPEFISIK